MNYHALAWFRTCKRIGGYTETHTASRHVTVMITSDWRRYVPRYTITKAIDLNLHRDRNICKVAEKQVESPR